MIAPLDVITRKKLILVKQIYQRALIQSQSAHSFVDRLLAVVGFDLANETLLKAVVSVLNPSARLANDFQGVFTQAETELTARAVTLPNRNQIKHVRNLRNDAQHRARYPNETEVSDCRVYTRDFLTQLFTDVWGESFESISLVDVLQNNVIKNHLVEAEQDFAKNDFMQTVVKSMVAFQKASDGLADSLTDSISYWIDKIVVKERFGEQKDSEKVFNAFTRTRELITLQTVGVNLQEYLKYKRLTRYISILISQSGHYETTFFSDNKPSKEEAEIVFNFVTNSIILIENLGEDVSLAYKPFS